MHRGGRGRAGLAPWRRDPAQNLPYLGLSTNLGDLDSRRSKSRKWYHIEIDRDAPTGGA